MDYDELTKVLDALDVLLVFCEGNPKAMTALAEVAAVAVKGQYA